jgi:hypothetical protein
MTTVSAQDRTNPVGNKVDRQFTIPPVEQNTTDVSAGRLTVAVEYRQLDDEVMAASYSAEQMQFVNQRRPNSGFDERGVSLHVIDARSGVELIRFDCFARDPHYHYLPDDQWQYVVPFDLHAGGDFYEWVLAALQRRLPDMLRFCGAAELADEVTLVDMVEFTNEVDRVARRADA